MSSVYKNPDWGPNLLPRHVPWYALTRNQTSNPLSTQEDAQLFEPLRLGRTQVFYNERSSIEYDSTCGKFNLGKIVEQD